MVAPRCIPSASSPAANPSSLSSNENQFMHAVSSNFPKATKYNQRGEGNIEPAIIKATTNASELNTIFDEIEKSETTNIRIHQCGDGGYAVGICRTCWQRL